MAEWVGSVMFVVGCWLLVQHKASIREQSEILLILDSNYQLTQLALLIKTSILIIFFFGLLSENNLTEF
jgi:hypothetical protein